MSDTEEVTPADQSPADAAPALPPSQLTPRERQIGFALAGLAAVSGVAQWLPDAIGKGDGKALALAGASLLLAAVFGFGVWSGRRLIAAFAAVLAGLPTPKYVVGTLLNALLLAFGAYLVLRYSNATGKRNAQKRQERAAARREGRSPARSRGSATSATSVPSPPPANKRYTPPKKTTKRR